MLCKEFVDSLKERWNKSWYEREASIDSSRNVDFRKEPKPVAQKIYVRIPLQKFAIYKSPTQKSIYNEEKAWQEELQKAVYFLRVRRPGL